MPAKLSGAERTPADTVTRRVQACERAPETAHVREDVFVGNEHVVHHNLAGDRGAQAHLAVYGRCGETLPAFLEDETTNVAGVILGPDNEHIGDR